MPMHEAGTDQLANCSGSGVLWVIPVGVSVEDQDQLIHREPSRMFIEEER